MLRQLKSVALVAATLGLVASASAEMNFESSGAMKWRGEEKSQAVGVTTARESDFSSMAVNWDLKFMPDPKVLVFFQPKFVKTLGDHADGSQGDGTTSTSGTTKDSGLDVHQSYMTYMHDDRLNFTFGRYEMNYGDHYVLGGVPWHMVGRAFDGMKVNYKWSKGWVDLFYNKIEERDLSTAITGVTHDDQDFYGFYHSMAINDMLTAFDVYYLVNSDRTTQSQPGPDLNMTTTGFRLKGGKGAVDGTFEWNTQGGEMNSGATKTDIEDADSMRLDLGFTFGNTRVGLEYATANRDYNQLYPTGHKWLGFGDWFSRQNMTTQVVHVSHKFMEHMSLGLDYHMFARTETGADKNGAYDGIYNFSGAAIGTASATNNQDAVGSELDLVLTCNKMKALTWQFGYSMFTAGEYLKNQNINRVGGAAAGDELDYNFAYLQATAKF